MVEILVFGLAAAICIAGAIGVIAFRNPVHNALSLVATLFGVAVLFVAAEAHFLAAIQVIVYAGAIVVLFLFVIMLLGVDRAENIRMEHSPLERPVAAVVAGLFCCAMIFVFVSSDHLITGQHGLVASLTEATNVELLAKGIFTDYVFAFEITSVLLIIAVVAAVVLVRNTGKDTDDQALFDAVYEANRATPAAATSIEDQSEIATEENS